MAKIQIISTDDNGGGNACEALWYAMAASALENGHQVEALVSYRSITHSTIKNLQNLGARIHSRWSEPKNSAAKLIAYKIWCRTGARWSFGRNLDTRADIRILNVGTMIELASEPWASIMESAKMPIAVIIHNNPEIRSYSDSITNRLTHLLQKTKVIFFVSERLRQNAELQLVTPISSAQVVRNPVNLSSTELEPWPEENGPLRIAVVGRLDAFVKGQIRLLYALSTDLWRERNWSLSIFGDGPDREKIQKAIDLHRLGDRVSFGGFVKDVRTSIWKKHHVLVMPSMLEGMPLTLVEAMVCGRPVLSTDVGGASELIRDGENGFLAGSPFVQQLAQGLEKLWNARAKLNHMGKQAHQDAVSFLSNNPGQELLDRITQAIHESK